MDEEIDWIERAKIKSAIDKNIKLLHNTERLSYSASVLKMYHDYEAMVFNLSEQSKNENIESIKVMTLGQRLKFQQLITERNNRLRNISNGE